MSFANYFVTDSLCCPSRSSIFTGEFPHDSGVYRDLEPDGAMAGSMPTAMNPVPSRLPSSAAVTGLRWSANI